MVPTEQITDERLNRWKERLRESHATPLCLIGIGHDHNSGTPVVVTLEEEEMPLATLRLFLRIVLSKL